MVINFTASGFTIPVALVHSSEPTVIARFPIISRSADAATGLVQRLVMNTVFDVLQQYGRSAGLPSDLLSLVLERLVVQTSYDPLQCNVVLNPTAMNNPFDTKLGNHCFIVGGTVTGLCTMQDCGVAVPNSIQAIPSEHLVISGNLTTTDAVMVIWSKTMWQSVMDRVARRLQSGPFPSNFFGFFITVL